MTMKRIFQIFTLLLCTLSAGAQINSTVEVHRDYEARMGDIIKSPLKPSWSDTLLRFDMDFDYSVFERKYTDLYDFTPMAAADLNHKGEARYPWLYADLRYGSLVSPALDFYVQPRLGGGSSLTVYGHHKSLWEGKMDDDLGNRSDSEAGAGYGFNWKKGEVRAGFSYENRFRQMHGDDPWGSDTRERSLDILNAFASVRSLAEGDAVFHYDADLQFHRLMKEQENLFDGTLNIGVTLRNAHKLLLGAHIQNAGNRSVAEAVPQYRMSLGRWKINAAAVFTFATDRIDCTSAVMPRVNVSFEAARNILWIYASADGRNSLGSAYRLQQLNSLAVLPEQPGNECIPVEAEGGIRGVASGIFSYEVSGRWTYAKSRLSFASDQSARYHECDWFTAAARMNLSSKIIEAGVDVKYNVLPQGGNVYLLPEFELDLSVTANIRRRWFITADCGIGTESRCISVPLAGAETVSTLPQYADLGFNVTYHISPTLSARVFGTNLLNQQIYRTARYREQGISLGGGIAVRL